MPPRLPPRLRLCARCAVLATLAVAPLSVWAQGPAGGSRNQPLPAVSAVPPVPTPDRPIQGETDPVVGSIEGHLIYLSDLGRASQSLPDNLRNVPFATLFPVLLDRMIDHEALVMMARRKGLEERPDVRREIEAATERVLEAALLGAEATPKVTEQAIQARYNRQYANRPASEEVHARHILVATEGEARKVIEDLQKGADFASMAKLISKDPDSQKGGDLGFFRREQVWPGFADVAFALQPGQISTTPVHNEFGWHVIKVEERRLVAPPSYSEIHDALRQELLAQAVRQVIDDARAQMVIHRFNLDGSEILTGSQRDTIEPSPTSAPPGR